MMESPTQRSEYTARFLADLRQALRGPLPGPRAQLQMAPEGKQTSPASADCPRHSAVLALFHPCNGTPPCGPDDVAVLFTRRQASLRYHGGQISFPGGGMEPQDLSYEATALRETEEEVGIPATSIEVVGRMSPLYIAHSQNLVIPVVGWTHRLPPLRLNPDEVSETFAAPLTALLDPTTQGECRWRRNGQTHTAPCYNVGRYAIWGATAMMLSELLEIARHL